MKGKLFGVAAVVAIVVVLAGLYIAFSQNISFHSKTVSGRLAAVGTSDPSVERKDSSATKPASIPIGVSGNDYLFLVNFLTTKNLLTPQDASSPSAVSSALAVYQASKGLPVTSTVDVATNIVLTADFLKGQSFTDDEHMTAAIEDLDAIFNNTYVPTVCSIGRMPNPNGPGCIGVLSKSYVIDEAHQRICWYATKTEPGGICWNYSPFPIETISVSQEQTAVVIALYNACVNSSPVYIAAKQNGTVEACVNQALATWTSQGGPVLPEGYEGWFLSPADSRICFGARINPGVDDSVWIKCLKWGGDASTLITPPVIPVTSTPPSGSGSSSSNTSAVSEAKTSLRTLGYYKKGSRINFYGSKIKKAVEEFQYDAGLPVTGELDTATQTAIREKEVASPSFNSESSTIIEENKTNKESCEISYDQGKTWHAGKYKSRDINRTCYPLEKIE